MTNVIPVKRVVSTVQLMAVNRCRVDDDCLINAYEVHPVFERR